MIYHKKALPQCPRFEATDYRDQVTLLVYGKDAGCMKQVHVGRSEAGNSASISYLTRCVGSVSMLSIRSAIHQHDFQARK